MEEKTQGLILKREPNLRSCSADMARERLTTAHLSYWLQLKTLRPRQTIWALYYLLLFKNVYSFLRDRDSPQVGQGQREIGRHRFRSRLQALSCQHRVRHGARTPELWVQNLSRSWMLNWLSHPGAPPSTFKINKAGCVGKSTGMGQSFNFYFLFVLPWGWEQSQSIMVLCVT